MSENNYSDEKYFDDNCIFCKIVEKQIPANIVYEDEYTVAFKDLQPKATIHLLVIPKVHIKDIMEVDEYYMSKVHNSIKNIANEMGLAEKGFRVISNCGAGAGQSVWHFHFHLLSGKYERFDNH